MEWKWMLTVDACRGVIFDAKINVLIDAKSKVARL